MPDKSTIFHPTYSNQRYLLRYREKWRFHRKEMAQMATLNRFTPQALEQHVRTHIEALVASGDLERSCCQLCELLLGEQNVD